MHSLGRNNLIGYSLPVSRKQALQTADLFSQPPTMISGSEGTNMAIGDSAGNSVSVHCHTLGEISLAVDGRLMKHDQLFRSILSNRAVLGKKSSEELVAHLLAEEATDDTSLPMLLEQFLGKYPGGYSLVIMFKDRIYAARDCYGVKPLVIGCIEDVKDVIEYDLENGRPTLKSKVPNVIASSSLILKQIGAKFVRQILPGEVVELSCTGVKSVGMQYRAAGDASTFCSLEYVVMESPRSFMEDQRVYDVRYRLGEALACESDVPSDCVTTLPNVSFAFVLGYAQVSGTRIIEAFHYSSSADHLSLYKEHVSGRVVTLVVDSTLNEDLTPALMLLAASSAQAVHLRICSPDIVSPCPFGIALSGGQTSSLKTVYSTAALTLDSLALTLRRKIPSHEVRNIGHCFSCFGQDHVMLKF